MGRLSLNCERLVGNNSKPKLTGYAHASGTAPYDKFSDTLLTVGDLCYSISVGRIDFFFHFVDKDVDIELNHDSITLKCEGRNLTAIVMNTCDAVSPADAGITQEQSDEMFNLISKTSPILSLC